MKKAFFAAVLLLSLMLLSCRPVKVLTADTTAPPPEPVRTEEMCGLWIATVMNINYPSRTGLSAENLRAELDSVIARAESLGANALFFQVRGAGDAFYASEIFPTSRYLVENEGDSLPDGFDPLAYLINSAHAAGIAVHAWVNPLRAAIGVTDTAKLSADNPARLHPEYVIPYVDKRLYFDAGLPEVRRLVADGVAEIVRNYDVDGIIFDDYFYPYPVASASGAVAEFDDAATFARYGEGYERLGDFRRASIDEMVRMCHEAIKAEDPDCRFGIAPFGIWKNDDGTNGGSATRGMSSYYDIFCDPLAWVEAGSVDYLAPQIYWSFDTERAPFAELCDWWDAALSGSGVDYYISYAPYRYEDDWDEPAGEMTAQVVYARDREAYRGGIFYGYGQISRNVAGVADELAALFAEKILYDDTSGS